MSDSQITIDRAARKAAYLREYRSRRKAAGLCTRCGNANDTDTVVCEACRIDSKSQRLGIRPPRPHKIAAEPTQEECRAYRRALVSRWRKAGVCTRCRGPRDSDGLTCNACRSLSNARHKDERIVTGPADNQRGKDRRQAWRDAGLCSICGGERDAAGRMCLACTADGRKNLTRQRQRRRDAGLCPRCGVRPPDAGWMHCGQCQERIRASYRRCWERDPTPFIERLRARRARKRGNGGSFTPQEWAAVKAAQGHTCLLCGKREPEIVLTVDHVFPVSKGGDSFITNIGAACGRCNKSKGDRLVPDYRHLAPFPELFPWFAD